MQPDHRHSPLCLAGRWSAWQGACVDNCVTFRCQSCAIVREEFETCNAVASTARRPGVKQGWSTVVVPENIRGGVCPFGLFPAQEDYFRACPAKGLARLKAQVGRRRSAGDAEVENVDGFHIATSPAHGMLTFAMVNRGAVLRRAAKGRHSQGARRDRSLFLSV